MVKQGLIPENFDPSDPKIDDPHERARILKLFDSHLARAERLRAAAATLDGAGQAGMVERNMADAPRPPVPDAGDSPLGFRLPLNRCPLSPPSIIPHLVPADPFAEREPLSDPRVTHPIKTRAARAASREAASPPLAPETLVMQRAPATTPSAESGSAGAHGAVGRGARRAGLRLHAAGRNAQRLSRTDRDHRSDRGRARPAGPCRRLCAAARSAAQCAQSHAGSRRHRSQYPSGGSWREAVDITRGVYEDAHHPGSAPTNSCSMAGIPEPAAAITSCSAA